MEKSPSQTALSSVVPALTLLGSSALCREERLSVMVIAHHRMHSNVDALVAYTTGVRTPIPPPPSPACFCLGAFLGQELRA